MPAAHQAILGPAPLPAIACPKITHLSYLTRFRLYIEGAIAVFVDVGSSSSRWFRKREGRSRVFCFPTKEMNREERLSKSLFAGLPNVKGAVAEDARITDSPLRSELASVIREKMALSGHLSF